MERFKQMKKLVSIVACVVLIFGLSSCEENKKSALSRSELYEAGFKEAYGEFYHAIDYEAVHYAKDNGGWHPEEAMCIIDAYENGEGYTEEEYREAVRSLYCFYEYFYNSWYKEVVDCDYYE
jgi:hypothetical protein